MNRLLPIFIKLENQPCLVIGGGKIAGQKIKQLLESKADVTVKSLEISDDLRSLPITIEKAIYRENDVKGYKLIIAATDDDNVNRQIYEDSQKNGIPVNVVDQPSLCTFYMGSVFQDGDVKVAISTNGKCPSFGKYIRDHSVEGLALDPFTLGSKHLYYYTKSLFFPRTQIRNYGLSGNHYLANCDQYISFTG